MTRSEKIDSLVITVICLFSLFIWWPTRDLAYHWDSAAFVIRAAEQFYQHGFNPLIAKFSEFAHPPFYPALIAASWKIFNTNRLITHLTILPFITILLISTYSLGKKFSGRPIAIYATLLTALTPFLLAEIGMPYLDLAAGALAALALTFWAYRRYRLSCITLTFAVLTKNTVILILLPFLIDILLDRSLRYRLRSYLPLIPPFLVTGLWLLYHFSQTGWWLTAPGRDTVMPTSFSQYLSSLRFVFYVFFLRQGRWLLTVFALFSYLRLRLQPSKVISRNLLLLLLTIGCTLLAFSLTGEFIPRYAIFLLPCFIILCVHLIYSAFKKPYNHITILTIAFVFILSLHPHSAAPANAWVFRLNEDLSYQDHIALGMKVAQFLETNYPQAFIYGGFPQSYQLTEPIMGYVSTPLNFINCADHRAPRSLGEVRSSLLYLHPYHHSQIICQELLSEYPFTLLQSFKVGSIWAKLYLYDPKI